MLERFRLIDTVDNGDCSLNGMTLGFVDLALIGKVNEQAAAGKYDNLLNKLHKKELLKQPTWIEFIAYLEANKLFPKKIQTDIAPVLRQIVNDAMNEKTMGDSQLYESNAQVFEAEFREYLLKQLRIPTNEKFVGGDIYLRIDAFLLKFKVATDNIRRELTQDKEFKLEDLQQVSKVTGNEPQKKAETIFETTVKRHINTHLLPWFKQEGMREFLKQMKKDGEWAGDMELKEASQYLQLDTIAYNTENFQYPLYTFHGTLNAAEYDEQTTQILVTRGVVDKQIIDGRLMLKDNSEIELREKVQELNAGNDVVSYWLEHEANKQRLAVHHTWLGDRTLLNALLYRGIITKQQDNAYFFVSDLTLETLWQKVSGINNSQDFMKAWNQAYKQQRRVYLSNPYAMHWFYLQPKEMNHWDLSSIDVSKKKTAAEALAENIHTAKTLLADWPATATTPSLMGILAAEVPSASSSSRRAQVYANQFDTNCYVPPFPAASSLEIEPSGEIVAIRIESSPAWVPTSEPSSPESPLISEEKVISMLNRVKSRRSPPSPLSSSPPGASFLAKRSRQTLSNTLLIQRAREAYSQLKTLQSENPFIQELAQNFLAMSTSGDITRKLSTYLALPDDLSIKFAEQKLQVPARVVQFCQEFKCEIFQQALIEIKQKFMEHMLWLTVHLKMGDAPRFIAVINTINTLINEDSEAIEEITQILNNINFDELDELFSNLEVKSPQALNDKKEEVTEFFLQFVSLYNIIKPESCAQAILAFLADSNKAEGVRTVFNKIAKEGLKSGNFTGLKTFDRELLSGNVPAIKSIEIFLSIFKRQFIQDHDEEKTQGITQRI